MNTPDPHHWTLNSCFGAFLSVWVHLELFRYCTKLAAKHAKLVQLMQKFRPLCPVRIFGKKCSRSTLLDPKLMFWCVSFRSGAFWTVSLLPGFTFPTGLAKPEESGSGIPVRFGRLPVRTGQIQIWIQTSQFNRFVSVYRPVWLVTGQIQFFFLFWFKFKCSQSILNKCLYNMF